MEGRSDADAAARAAMLCAAAMIAQQVGARATRDALFLSSFDVSALPAMVVAAAAASFVFVLSTSRVMAALGPARLVPAAFAASGVLLVGEWWLALRAPRLGAVAVYLHVATFGSVLTSGFWSVVSERFDPRTAKTWIGRIAGAGTLGGLAGGLAAERVAAHVGVAGMLPVLAALHVCCGAVAGRLRPARDAEEERLAGGAAGAPASPGPGLVGRDPYLRSIAALVMVGAVAGTLMDYAFKAEAFAALGGGPLLMRAFAAFYTLIALLSFLVQAAFGRLSLERLGLARTVAALPASVAAGGAAMLLLPGLGAALAARAGEAVLRGSLYRLGYELLYTPVPPGEKRATKPIMDVALDRLGEMAGGGLVRLALLLAPSLVVPVLSDMLLLLGLLGILLASRLHRGYVRALEKSLLARAVELDLSGIVDRTTRTTVLRALMDRPARPGPAAPGVPAMDPDALESGLFLLSSSSAVAFGLPSAAGAEAPAARAAPRDPVVARTIELRSKDAGRVRRALEARPLDPLLAPHVVALLAWDEVAEDAAEALRAIAPGIIGQLVDSLLDTSVEFAIRRRIPRVLRAAPMQRTLDGLLQGLQDRRFEVRLECGRALGVLREGASPIHVDQGLVFSAVLKEAAVDRRLWESERLLDRSAEGDETFLIDDALRRRGSRSLEHVFTLLSLALPKQPLLISFRALHTQDERLRGTALEYLESVLPAAVRDSLWPFLEEGGPKQPQPRSREEILEELLRSHPSVELSLTALRGKARSRT